MHCSKSKTRLLNQSKYSDSSNSMIVNADKPNLNISYSKYLQRSSSKLSKSLSKEKSK